MTADQEQRIERAEDWQREGLSILSNAPSVDVTDYGCWPSDYDDALLGSYELRFRNVTVGVNERDTVLNQREELVRLIEAYDVWLTEDAAKKQAKALKRAS